MIFPPFSIAVMYNGLNDVQLPYPPGGSPTAKDTPNVKKRHRRAKSGANKNNPDDGADSDGYEFIIVSLENKQWHFEAPSTDVS